MGLGDQLDGSWFDVQFGAGIFLASEDNANANELLYRARRNESDLTAMLRRVERSIRSLYPQVQLIGPGEQTQLKSPRSLKRKVYLKMRGKKGCDSTRVVDRIRDSVRYTLIAPDGQYSDLVRRAHCDLVGSGYENIKWKNTWNMGNYRGINSSWVDHRSGQKFEIQFHTPSSLQAQRSVHDLHVKQRLYRSDTRMAKEVRDRLKERYRDLDTPTGAAHLKFHTALRGKNGGGLRLSELLSIAEIKEIALRLHSGQLDKSGGAYSCHLSAVAEGVRAHGGSHDQIAAAWLHDSVEDGAVSVEEIDGLNLSERVKALVIALTRPPGEDLRKYAERIITTPGALLIKQQDIANNTAPDRMALLKVDDRRRLTKKYREMQEAMKEAGAENRPRPEGDSL